LTPVNNRTASLLGNESVPIQWHSAGSLGWTAVQADANKICDWRSEVLAAEAKKAGSASECT